MKSRFLLSYVIAIIILSIGNGHAQKVYNARVNQNEIISPKTALSPSINSPEVYGARPNKPFIYRLPVSGLRPMEITASGIPATMQLNQSTGIITGYTPKEKGHYKILFTAKNNKGIDSKEFVLIVGDTISLTPPMGWNHWQTYYHFITDDIIRKHADAMVSSGLADVGYQYITIDDCWMRIDQRFVEDAIDPSRKTVSSGLNIETKVGVVRDEKGVIIPAKDFPNMKALTDYIHSFGLKAGIYSSPGELTCQRFEGSYGHEFVDAKAYSDWGFDMLKYDWCSYDEIHNVMKGDKIVNRSFPYRLMGGAIHQQERDVLLNVCEYGNQVWEWGNDAGWQYWRIGGDLAHTILEDGVYKIAEKTISLRKYNGPGSWNDPDFLLIGKWVSPFDKAALPKLMGMTTNEEYTYFSLWCMMACPLVISSTLLDMDELHLSILSNKEMIAVNQDRLGKCATPIIMNDNKWMLKKVLADGSVVIGVFDISGKENTIKLQWSELGLEGKHLVRDVWRQKEVGKFDSELNVVVSPKGCAIFKLSKQN